jgi:two-component system, chemotaxis family, protein-glutamate methylesterase/glutaminase
MKTIQRVLGPGEKIRVLSVDDSVVIRRLIAQALSGHPSIEMVASAPNGVVALQRIAQLRPDVVTLDIEMPDMDGLEVLRRIRKEFPATRVIMFSTLTERGAGITLEALALGADDYVTKSTNNEAGTEGPVVRLQSGLIPKITQFFHFEGEGDAAEPGVPAVRPKIGNPLPSLRKKGVPKAIAIGVSTGGPNALGTILPKFPATLALPILIVQHMPPLFTRFLAERLNSVCALRVEEAVEGSVVERGKVLIAPGDFHMRVMEKNGRIGISLDQSPQENFCRPAVDVLFRSAAEVYGNSVIAVVLTGMGQDGLRGTEKLKAQGATVLAQDEASSVVWGMPGAVVQSGLADKVVPLDDIVPQIMSTIAEK